MTKFEEYQVCSTERRGLAAKFPGSKWSTVCLEVLLGAWEPDPFLLSFFCDTKQEVISDRKKNVQKYVRLYVPSATSRYRPPTVLKLGGKDSKVSGAYTPQFLSASVACEATTRGGGEVLCAKSSFFCCPGRRWNRNDPSLPTALLAGVLYDEGKSCLFSVF